MVENNIMAHLDVEISDLEETITKVKIENEILKLNIQKKKLLLQRMELEQL